MKIIIAYLLSFLTIILTLWLLHLEGFTPSWINDIGLLFHCILAGGIGGIMYCLRSVYINACARKNWDAEWNPWYYIRPIVSLISGAVSWLFLRAGLLVLDASQPTGSSSFGFLALAFIAGYNVDKFLKKIEGISEATWGIKPSRSSTIGEGKEDE